MADEDQRLGRIDVARTQGGSSRFRAFYILVDGERVGQLRRGETLSYEASPGWHEVQATIDWTQSRPLGVEVRPGETAQVICRTRWSDPLLALWIISFGRNNYPYLETAA